MSGIKILSCDEYLENARNNAQKEMKDHEIVARTDRSWVCKTKGENNFWFEAVVVSAGSLLVHGDISCVLFSQCRYTNPESVLRWMGTTNDICYYVMQKATIGMTGGYLLESFNEGVWWHEALRHLEDVLDDSTKYENVRAKPDFSDIEGLVPSWLFEIVSEGPSEGGEVGAFESRAYDAGVHGWGRVPTYRLIHAHEATRKLCQLLDKEKAELELKRLAMEAKFTDDIPIEEIEPRLRLGSLVRRARVAAGMKLNRVADDLGITNVMLGQVERGLVPFSVDQIKSFALLTLCEYAPLFEASRAFHTSIWDGSPLGSSVALIGGDEKTFIAEEEETLDE